MRFPRPRITVRGMMLAVALVAIALWPVHCSRQQPYYEERAGFHGLMARLCGDEAVLWRSRADACTDRAIRGARGTIPAKRPRISSAVPSW